MITQTLKQENNEIRIESAESLEDAKNNGFNQGEYSRFFINNKPVPGYMSIIQHIIKETPKNGNFIINTESLLKKRTELINNQVKSIKDQANALKEYYKSQGISDTVLKSLDEYIHKIDEYGVRVKQ